MKQKKAHGNKVQKSSSAGKKKKKKTGRRGGGGNQNRGRKEKITKDLLLFSLRSVTKCCQCTPSPSVLKGVDKPLSCNALWTPLGTGAKKTNGPGTTSGGSVLLNIR